jgi:dCTP deaminase
MSVIPLTVDHPGASVVRTQPEFDIEGDAILVTGLDSRQLTEEDASNVSYDLRVGSQYRDHRQRGAKDIPNGGVISLHPGAAVIIQTLESIRLPRRLYGSIAPKVSLLQLGLSSTYSKVDPGYGGHLLITLFNLGKTTIPLRYGDRFCALTIFEVAPDARLYEKGSKQIKGEPAKQPRRTLRDFLEAHHIVVMIVLIVARLLDAIDHFVVFLLSRHP